VKVSAAKPRYGVLNFERTSERSEETRKAIALAVLVAALAAANIWFVVLPFLDEPHRGAADCRSLVLTRSGVTKCIPDAPAGAPIPRAEG
jgi:hypothetical protein